LVQITARAFRAAVLAGATAFSFATPLRAQRADSSFAGLVARLSEPGGYFDSDNIITNEASYLHVTSQLEKARVRGGIYIGVGPDQNFSYIALIKPQIALMVDIRRDNMLEHLLFKSVFAMARNRMEYICLLLGKPVPSDVERWTGRPTAEIISYVNLTGTSFEAAAATKKASNDRITGFGVPLDARDRATIDKYRMEFVTSGLDTRYSSLGRNNRSEYPSFGQLITATDRSGKQIGYLGNEDAFQTVRSMQLSDRIIPIVGNVAGAQAMSAIAAYAAERRLNVSAFYLSNVEQYLIQRNQGFDKYVANVRRLPHDSTSVIIRSYFGRIGVLHPLYVPAPGNISTSMAEPIRNFLRRYDAGEIRDYLDLVMSGFISP
jgi:hypothetical protein